MAHDPGRQIPPPLNPNLLAMMARLHDGYECLHKNIEYFRTRVTELVKDGKLDPAEQRGLLTHCDVYQDAVFTAAQIAGRWDPNGPDAHKVTPEVHRIADHAKYVYAVGGRDAVALQQKLVLLADTGKIDIEAHNKLQHHACYQIGEEVYSSTTSSLHDQNIWDGGWDWDDNTYSDGRQVMTQVRIKGWLELEREWKLTLRNKDIVIYGDGPINDFPLGSVCDINPPEQGSHEARGAGWIEIDLDELNAKITMFTAEGEL